MSLSACVGILEIIYYSLLPHFRLEPRLAVTPPICYLPLDLAVCAALNHHHHHHHHHIILICHSKCRYKSSDPSCHFVAEVLLVSSPAVHCLVIGLGLYHSTPFAEKTQKGTKSRSEVSVDWFRWNWVEIFNKGEWQCYYSTEWPFFSHHCVYRKIRAVFVEIRKKFPSKKMCIFV